jgi:hypothetical protein
MPVRTVGRDRRREPRGRKAALKREDGEGSQMRKQEGRKAALKREDGEGSQMRKQEGQPA